MDKKITIETLELTRDRLEKRIDDKKFMRVPSKLYKNNQGAYTPLLVFLGPFLHRVKDANILTMESKKRVYMLQLLERAEPSAREALENCRNFVVGNLLNIMEYYQEEIESFEILENTMLVDGCFLLAYLYLLNMGSFPLLLDDADTLQLKREAGLMRRDVVLLQNQIPFNILKGLYSCLIQHIDEYYSITHLLDRPEIGIEVVILQCHRLTPYSKLEGVMNLLLRLDQRFTSRQGEDMDERLPKIMSEMSMQPVQVMNDISELLGQVITDISELEGHISRYIQQVKNSIPIHLLDVIRNHHCPLLSKSDGTTLLLINNATQLTARGVNIQRSKVGALLELCFSEGVLKIPTLIIDDYTETLLINLVAHEHLSADSEHYFTSYVFFMAQLIESEDDFKLLEKKDIIRNRLGSRNKTSKLFSNITSQLVLNDFCYSALCTQISTYVDSPLRTYTLDLKRRYFSSPWKILSVFAATVLLVLSLLQTIYTIMSFDQTRSPGS